MLLIYLPTSTTTESDPAKVAGAAPKRERFNGSD